MQVTSCALIAMLATSTAANAALVKLHMQQFAVDGNGALPGTTTWQLFAEFDDAGDQLTSVGGAYPTVGAIVSTGGFYQNPYGGPTSAHINAAFYPLFPTLYYDSWVTIGGHDFADSATLVSTGLNTTAFEAGGDFFITNGEWTRPQNDPYAFGQVLAGLPNWHVLVGQFTTIGYGQASAPWGQLNLSGYSTGFLAGEQVPWSVNEVMFGTPVPAPATMALLPLLGLAARRRRR